MFRRVIILLGLILFAWLLPLTLKRCTHSFHLSRLMIDLPQDKNWSSKNLIPMDEIYDILSQPFHYLDRGSQAFVFSSEDHKYVLKLFLFDRESTLINRCLNRVQDDWNETLFTRSKKALDASAIAAKHVPDLTGLVYVHLNASNEHLPPVLLVGSAWHRNRLDLNGVRFVLQRRVDSLERMLLKAYRDNDRQRFCQIVEQVDHLISFRMSHGICNEDATLFDNFGFLDGKAYEVDFGQYVMSPITSAEKSKYMTQLYRWMENKTPRWKDQVAIQQEPL
jgi:hypothetical protein